MGKIICIDGNIGAGKSTLLEELSNRGYYVFKEDIERWGFLNKFYKDPKRWGFTLQVSILNSLCDQFKEMKELCKTNEFVFVERSPETSMLFGKNSYELGYISEEEFKVYKECFDKLIWFPDVKFFIETNVDECLARIQARGRDCEKNLKKDYLERICSGYKNISFDKYFSGMDSPQQIADKMIEKIREIL